LLLRLDQYGNPESSEIFAAALAEFEVKVNNATEVMIKPKTGGGGFCRVGVGRVLGCCIDLRDSFVCDEAGQLQWPGSFKFVFMGSSP